MNGLWPGELKNICGTLEYVYHKTNFYRKVKMYQKEALYRFYPYLIYIKNFILTDKLYPIIQLPNDDDHDDP
jgi:hypothetical protein